MTGGLSELGDLLRRRLGVRLGLDLQGDLLDRFVDGRLAALQLRDPGAYLDRLAGEPVEGDEFAALISVVTNPHTFFFRDQDQLQSVQETLRGLQREGRRPLWIWSAGCASGEEAYTIAMLCLDAGLQARVLGTDVNREVLAMARAARYQAWTLRYLPAGWATRYFAREADGFKVCPEVRRLVELSVHNLLEIPPRPASGWDAIVCRNVFIHFDPAMIAPAAGQLASALSTGGFLYVGAGETLRGMESGLQLTIAGRATAYVKPVPGSRPAELAPPAEMVPPVRPRTVAEKASPARQPVSSPRTEQAGATTRDAAEYERALEAADGGDLAGAREQLVALLARDPSQVAAQISLGNLYLRGHAFEPALAAYQEALARMPLLAEPHFLQGIVYRKLGDQERALQALRRALFLEASFWPASFLLAGVHRRRGKPQDALRELAHTLSILRQPPLPELFRSHVRGMRDAELDPDEVAAACEKELAAGGGASLTTTRPGRRRGGLERI